MNKNLAFVLLNAQMRDVLKEDNKVTEFVNRDDVRKVLTLTTSVFPGGFVAIGILYEKVPPLPGDAAAETPADKAASPAKKKPRRRALR